MFFSRRDRKGDGYIARLKELFDVIILRCEEHDEDEMIDSHGESILLSKIQSAIELLTQQYFGDGVFVENFIKGPALRLETTPACVSERKDVHKCVFVSQGCHSTRGEFASALEMGIRTPPIRSVSGECSAAPPCVPRPPMAHPDLLRTHAYDPSKLTANLDSLLRFATKKTTFSRAAFTQLGDNDYGCSAADNSGLQDGEGAERCKSLSEAIEYCGVIGTYLNHVFENLPKNLPEAYEISDCVCTHNVETQGEVPDSVVDASSNIGFEASVSSESRSPIAALPHSVAPFNSAEAAEVPLQIVYRDRVGEILKLLIRWLVAGIVRPAHLHKSRSDESEMDGCGSGSCSLTLQRGCSDSFGLAHDNMRDSQGRGGMQSIASSDSTSSSECGREDFFELYSTAAQVINTLFLNMPCSWGPRLGTLLADGIFAALLGEQSRLGGIETVRRGDTLPSSYIEIAVQRLLSVSIEAAASSESIDHRLNHEAPQRRRSSVLTLNVQRSLFDDSLFSRLAMRSGDLRQAIITDPEDVVSKGKSYGKDSASKRGRGDGKKLSKFSPSKGKGTKESKGEKGGFWGILIRFFNGRAVCTSGGKSVGYTRQQNGDEGGNVSFVFDDAVRHCGANLRSSAPKFPQMLQDYSPVLMKYFFCECVLKIIKNINLFSIDYQYKVHRSLDDIADLSGFSSRAVSASQINGSARLGSGDSQGRSENEVHEARAALLYAAIRRLNNSHIIANPKLDKVYKGVFVQFTAPNSRPSASETRMCLENLAALSQMVLLPPSVLLSMLAAALEAPSSAVELSMRTSSECARYRAESSRAILLGHNQQRVHSHTLIVNSILLSVGPAAMRALARTLKNRNVNAKLLLTTLKEYVREADIHSPTAHSGQFCSYPEGPVTPVSVVACRTVTLLTILLYALRKPIDTPALDGSIYGPMRSTFSSCSHPYTYYELLEKVLMLVTNFATTSELVCVLFAPVRVLAMLPISGAEQSFFSIPGQDEKGMGACLNGEASGLNDIMSSSNHRNRINTSTSQCTEALSVSVWYMIKRYILAGPERESESVSGDGGGVSSLSPLTVHNCSTLDSSSDALVASSLRVATQAMQTVVVVFRTWLNEVTSIMSPLSNHQSGAEGGIPTGRPSSRPSSPLSDPDVRRRAGQEIVTRVVNLLCTEAVDFNNTIWRHKTSRSVPSRLACWSAVEAFVSLVGTVLKADEEGKLGFISSQAALLSALSRPVGIAQKNFCPSRTSVGDCVEGTKTPDFTPILNVHSNIENNIHQSSQSEEFDSVLTSTVFGSAPVMQTIFMIAKHITTSLDRLHTCKGGRTTSYRVVATNTIDKKETEIQLAVSSALLRCLPPEIEICRSLQLIVTEGGDAESAS